MATYAKSICVDFDGVINSYSSGWQGVQNANDPPVPGAIEWLTEMVNNPEFRICIYSSRSKDELGIKCMRNYLKKNGMPREIVNEIYFPAQKPPAWLTIDDRAICFKGVFPSAKEMLKFKTWNKK